MDSSHLLITAISSLLAGASVALAVLWVGPVWDHLARRRVADLIPKLQSVGLGEEAIQGYLRTWGIALIGLPIVLGVVFRMPPVALGVAYVVWIAPRYLLDAYIARRRQKLRDQLVRATVGLANTTRAGMSLIQGLESACLDTPQPLQGEFRRIVREYHSGRPLADCLRDAQRRLNIESFTVFTVTLLACMERGGKIPHALERISESLQEQQRLERKIEADTAAGRKLATVLAMFPLFFLVGFTLLDPVSMSYLYNTLIGQIVLLAVGGIVYLSVRWCGRILRIEV